MVEDVKELRPDSEVGTFPVGNLEHLGDREVGIEKLRTCELVPALLAEAAGSKAEVRGKQTRSCRVCRLTSATLASPQNLRWN